MPSRSLPPVLLLDLDDTILSYSIGKPDFWGHALEEHSDRLPEAPERALILADILAVAHDFWSDPARAARGRLDLRGSRRHIARTCFERLAIGPPSVAESVADRFMDLKESAVAPFPGAIEALDELRSQNVRLGLITNGGSSLQRAKLKRYALEPYFEVIVVEGELGIGKPHARAFQTALSQLEIAPEDTWMVGDNLEADVGGARAVGIYAVWNNPDAHPLPASASSAPDREIRHLADLLEAGPDIDRTR